MSIDRFYIEPVTIRRAPTVTNAYNNTVADWGAATDTIVNGWVARWSGRVGDEENLDRRDAAAITDLVFFPVGTDITMLDRVVIRGVLYEVSGPPYAAPTPDSGDHHLEVRVVAVEG